MKIYQSSLGILLGPTHGCIVFGEKSNAVGITYNLATNLHQTESLAEQYLDFIQKLYAEQSYIGEYFEQIHLSPIAASVSTDSSYVSQELVVVLSELLEKWIAADSLTIQVLSHRSVELIAQKKFLSFHDKSSDSLASNPNGIDDAYALWSLTFSESSSIARGKTPKTFMSLDYEEINVDIADRYLSRYKIETIVRFGSTKFVHEDAERQRLYIMQLAEKSETSKYDLLVCRERLLELLEKYSMSKAVASAGSTITGRIVQSQAKQSLIAAPISATVDVELYDNTVSKADWPDNSKNSPNHYQQPTASNPESTVDDSADYFTSPKFTVHQNVNNDAPDRKFWKEATATPMRVDAWLFRIVVVLALVAAYFLYPLIY